jgi:acyl carrier protein
MPEQVKAMIDYILSDVVRRPGLQIEENTPLVSSGIIDSFSLVDILMKLEDVTNLRIPPGKVSPKDMNTVALMLSTARRVGKPKK